MNTKSLLLAGALGLSLAGLAHAQQYVYLTGSTACRGIVDTTLQDASGNSVFDAGGPSKVVYQGNTSAGKATYVNYTGKIGGADYIIKCYWTGSEGGITDLAGRQEQFLDDSATTGGSGPLTSLQNVDIAMADNSVFYSRTPSAAVSGTNVGIIAFEWVKEKGSSASLTNVTDETLRQALAGNAKLALFSGNTNDQDHVYVSGRDNQSGTRVNALGTCRFGIFTIPNQVEVDATTGAMLNQGSSTNPIYLGDYGYPSGGTLATQMGADLSQATSKDVSPLGYGTNHFSVIAYLGISDATTAIGKGAAALSYNGIPYSVQAIEEGQYNFWGNEYVYHANSAGSSAMAVYGKLAAATGIAGHADDSALISLGHMHCSRTAPTADPVHR